VRKGQQLQHALWTQQAQVACPPAEQPPGQAWEQPAPPIFLKTAFLNTHKLLSYFLVWFYFTAKTKEVAALVPFPFYGLVLFQAIALWASRQRRFKTAFALVFKLWL
jgi:hypothetical protein